MFYQDAPDNAPRFGDILSGFVLAAPSISELSSFSKYNIEIEHPEYGVILSPCCSIGNVLTVSPLIYINANFFTNPYFKEDLTRLNRKMPPDKTVSQEIWEKKIDPEEKVRRLAEGETYAFIENFIFEEHRILKKYNVKPKGEAEVQTSYYMIDFKRQHKINCKNIPSASNAQTASKILQLSIGTRAELRDKISFYYSRIPKEDIVIED